MNKQQGTHKFTPEQQAAMDTLLDDTRASRGLNDLDDIVVKLKDSLVLMESLPGSREVSIARTCIETAGYRLRDLQEARDGIAKHHGAM